MAHLSLTLFGQFWVTLDSQPITDFRSEKVRALLAYLVTESSSKPDQAVDTTGNVHSRTELATLFWPGYREESARTSLRQALHQLRKLLGDDIVTNEQDGFLRISRQAIEFNPNASRWVDIHLFNDLLAACAVHSHQQVDECPACLARLQQAIDLYRGDFLASFVIDDSTTFEEWRRIKQEQYHLQILMILKHLTSAAMKAGDYERARQLATRQLVLEPWREDAHRQLIRALAQNGDRNAALAQYYTCRQTLMQELGVEPDATTTQLYEQVRSGAFPSGAQEKTIPATPMSPGASVQHAQSLPQSTTQERPNLLGESVMPLTGLPIAASNEELEAASEQKIPPHNLPRQFTPFVGRTDEVAHLAAQLQQPDCYLLTLIGPGGIGKTRLAQQVGQRLMGAFGDGLFFVALDSLNDPEKLETEITTVIGMTLFGSLPQEKLAHLLRGKRVLLILDNFEHLLPGAKLLAELLQATEHLKVIVTSRERLNLPGEQLFTVEGLPYPASKALKEAAASTAVQLFVERGQRVLPDFRLSEATLASILRICYLAQGMPLALELAAAWLGVLPVREIAEELARSADFLTVDWQQAVPTRQQSMRAAFSWSWRLLNDGEQKVFRRLSIFRGGFTRDAAEKVADASLRNLAGLVHKSLLQWLDPQATTPRYQIHELLRQFAAEELNTSGEEQAIALRHSDYYLTLIAAREEELRSQSGTAVTTIQGELDNIRQAWSLATDQKRIEHLACSAHALAQFYNLVGLAEQAVQMFSQAAQAIQSEPEFVTHGAANGQRQQQLMSSLLALQAEALLMLGHYQEGDLCAEKAIILGRASINSRAECLGKFIRPKVLAIKGNLAMAEQEMYETLELINRYKANHLDHGQLVETELSTILWLGHLAMLHDEYQKAKEQFTVGLQAARLMKRQHPEVSFLLNLAGLLVYAFGDYSQARQHYAAAYKQSSTIGYRWGEASALLECGELLRCQGEYSAALHSYQGALTIFEAIHHPIKLALAQMCLGMLCMYLGDRERAEQHFTWLAQSLTQMPENRTQYNVLLALATYEYRSNRIEQALRYVSQGFQAMGSTSHVTLRIAYFAMSGHCQASLHHDAEATTSYQQALALCAKLEFSAPAAEAHAGLAKLALDQGDLASALQSVDQILPILQKYPLAGFDEPFFVYLTSYQVLATAHDPRAEPILEQGWQILQRYASQIEDEKLRRSFLDTVPLHRALQESYTTSCRLQ